CGLCQAGRGCGLLLPARYALRPAFGEWHAESTVDEVIAGSGWQLLGHTQRLAEQYRHTGQWKLFRDLTTHLTMLRAYFGVFDLALPRSAGQSFVQPLDQLIGAFRPLALAGWAEEGAGQAARDQAAVLFNEVVEDRAWGELFISLALWLHQSGWKQARPPRGDKIGALAVPRWLLAAVAKEIQSLI